jgi:predicted ArsR family transcriptional regulator
MTPPNKLEEIMQQVALDFLPKQYRKTLAILAEEPVTVESLSVELDTSLEYARLVMHRLKKCGVVCVVHWKRTGTNGMPTKVWGFGNKDVRQPSKLTNAERSARSRRKKKVLEGSVRIGIWGI